MSDRLDRRINAFVVELLDNPVEPPPFPDEAEVALVPRSRPRVPGWAIAVAVFVIVILSGLVPFLISQVELEPVVDTPPEDVVEDFTDALNEGDLEATLKLFSDDGTCVAPGLPTCSDILGFFVAASGRVVFEECSVDIPPYLQCQGYMHTAIHDALGLSEIDLAGQPNFPAAFLVEEGKIVQFSFYSPFTGDAGADDRFWAYLARVGADYLSDDGIPEFTAEVVPRLIEDATRYAEESGG